MQVFTNWGLIEIELLCLSVKLFSAGAPIGNTVHKNPFK